ncbi:predicted protein [Naegleria gruberi]|uniref:Predicted protein n=1 Tax=Naegleria gruberi TaxID=5762 RepID=D2W3A2_NAEGR|nr:uncharacterized protein NAEGRDRAFT_75874 [Naegleria gruberi]EFC36453.1 predicted protein [Naegleria gruberi]|eukprot:XP_002669197.1 predicted protein [Naegleria gruberi strain NEG-M]
MAMIPVSYWEKFDLLFLKQKYPSFLHKHPRKTTNGQTMNSLKAIEVYMITHYYLELFTCIENYQAIEREVNLIRRFVNIIDSLTDSFISSELEQKHFLNH